MGSSTATVFSSGYAVRDELLTPMDSSKSNHPVHLLVAATAAFCTYFCMYAFRKPFTAGTYAGEEFSGLSLKAALVISQLAGYMLSKFIGIRVISEMRQQHRAATIVGLILTAEIALVGFAYVPIRWKLIMLFFNGLPLGMVFGLVLSYLEGRKLTEALSAVLCASFIIASGVVKSVGRWLVETHGVSEFHMPMMTGAIFLLPLLISVWILQRTPPPDHLDRELRSERKAINRQARKKFLAAYWPGLTLLVFVYVALTVIRTIRDDFGVEIWRDLGVQKKPSVFTTSETAVALIVTAFNGLAIWFKHNLAAIRVTVLMMCAAFLLVGGAALMQNSGLLSPFGFMVACGIGLYIPYVAYHTTVFERLIAASRYPSNLGFLMYVADAIGYLGYAVVLAARTSLQSPGSVLPFFRIVLLTVAGASILALIVSLLYFHRVLPNEVHAADQVIPQDINSE